MFGYKNSLYGLNNKWKMEGVKTFELIEKSREIVQNMWEKYGEKLKDMEEQHEKS